MRYWDSSALLPLILKEPRSGETHGLVEGDPSVVSWWSTPVECFSGLWRMKKARSLAEEEFQNVRQAFDRLMSEIDLVPPSRVLRDRALRLLSLHALRAGDALQLAAALQWCREQTQGVGFVCLDERLRSAALAEGFSVLP